MGGFAGFNINFNTRRYLAHHSLYSVPTTYTRTNDRKGKLVPPWNTRAFIRSVAVYRVQTILPLISKLTLYYDHVVLKLGNSAHVPHWCKCCIVYFSNSVPPRLSVHAVVFRVDTAVQFTCTTYQEKQAKKCYTRTRALGNQKRVPHQNTTVEKTIPISFIYLRCNKNNNHCDNRAITGHR